jgi:hypothetical protein
VPQAVQRTTSVPLAVVAVPAVEEHGRAREPQELCLERPEVPLHEADTFTQEVKELEHEFLTSGSHSTHATLGASVNSPPSLSEI